MTALAPYDPYWIEEPTSPDDILGHAAIRAAGRQPGQGRHRRARREPGRLQAAAPGRRDRLRADRRRPGRPASTRTSRSCCSPPSSACRSARTPAASACASWSSTCRCSTTWRSPARMEDRVIEYVDHLHEHFVDPVVIRRRATTWRPAAPGFSATHAARSPSRTYHLPGRRPSGHADLARRGAGMTTSDKRPGYRVSGLRGADRPGDRRRLRHRRAPPPRCSLRAGHGSPSSTSTPASGPRGTARRRADVTDDAAVRAAVGGGRGLGGTGHPGQQRRDRRRSAPSRTTTTTSGTGSSTSTCVGMVRTARAALPHLRRSPRTAAIVNTCSIAATAGLPQRALYSATKGAVLVADPRMAADHVREGDPRQLRRTPAPPTPRGSAGCSTPADDPAAERAALDARQPIGRLVSRRRGRRRHRLPGEPARPARPPARRSPSTAACRACGCPGPEPATNGHRRARVRGGPPVAGPAADAIQRADESY